MIGGHLTLTGEAQALRAEGAFAGTFPRTPDADCFELRLGQGASSFRVTAFVDGHGHWQFLTAHGLPVLYPHRWGTTDAGVQSFEVWIPHGVRVQFEGLSTKGERTRLVDGCVGPAPLLDWQRAALAAGWTPPP